MWEGDFAVGVVLKTDHKDNNQFTSLGNEYIPVMGGTTSVPLRQFATITPDFTDGCIVRRNGVRTISVVAEPMRGYNADCLAKQVKASVAKLSLPKEVEVHIGGML